MVVITIIGFIVFFFAYLGDRHKTDEHNRFLKESSLKRGEVAYHQRVGNKTFIYHYPTGKRCREWLEFDNKGYAYHYYTNFYTDEILGGQYSDYPKKMLSVKEVQDLLKEEKQRQEKNRKETEEHFYKDHPEYTKRK